MRTFSVVLFLFFTLNALTQNLNDQMWKFVSDCKGAILDPGFEDNTYDSLVDDSKNGYLFISGSWPTCGCSCENTVGAFKKKDNTYVLLKEEIWNCSWKRGFYSNEDFFKIFPVGFGLKAFTEKGEDPNITLNNGLFYLDVEIPRIGTETKLELKLVPFGIYATCKNGLCFEFSEQSGQTKFMNPLMEFVNKAKSDESLMLILAGRQNEMEASDLKLLKSVIQENGSNYTLPDLEMDLKSLFFAFNAYKKLHYTTIILKWDKESGRFVIKEKKGQLPKFEFLEFLKSGPWYMPVC